MKTRMKGVTLGVLLAFAGAGGLPESASASGIPVVDVANLAQAVQQYTQMVAQLKQLEAQLAQAKQQYEAFTGGRGMENLLRNENRNVIPTNWQETLAMMEGGGQISSLAKSIKDQASKMDTASLDRLAPYLRDMSTGMANTAASEQAVAGTAYDNASQRFSRLQQLMDAIGTAQDAKGIADLQARIEVEQLMLQNEAIKMQSLQQIATAQQKIQDQQLRELAVDKPSSTQQPGNVW